MICKQETLGSKARLAIIVITIVLLVAGDCGAVERIWLEDATINGKPVKIIFDSGGYGHLTHEGRGQTLGAKSS
jgi:hypothetical protein